MRKLLAPLCAMAIMASAAPQSLETELIFPKQDKHVHGSTLVELPDGDILAAWFYGSGERSADDVLIQGARRNAKTGAWSEPFVMADLPGVPDCNPVLFVDNQERLWLFWLSVMANRWETSLLMYRRADSLDFDGAPAWSWQSPITLQPGPSFAQQLREGFDAIGYGQDMWAEYAPPYDRLLVEAAQDKFKRRIGWMTRGHAVQLASGRIVLPVYSDGFNVSLMAYSDDAGETWAASGPIVGLGPIQPSLAQRQDGVLVAYMRDSGPLPKRVMQATSADNGETWSAAEDTRLLGSSASVQVCVLEDGDWLLVHNDTAFGRNRLSVSRSEDEGETWPLKRTVMEAEEGGFSYPSIIQGRGGAIHITYSHSTAEGASIAHASFAPTWMEASEAR